MNLSNKLTLINFLKSCAIAITILGLNNCGSTGNTYSANGFQQDHGPFDRNGNYVESWADNPPNRNRSWRPSTPIKPVSNPVIASNPAPTRSIFGKFTSNTPPKTTYTPPRTAAYTPPRTTYTPPTTSYTPPKKVTPPPVVKRPIAKTITPKTKPPIFHTVKKGDTLYELSIKYGTSVVAIQKANNIKGTNISIGKRLIIPRK